MRYTHWENISQGSASEAVNADGSHVHLVCGEHHSWHCPRLATRRICVLSARRLGPGTSMAHRDTALLNKLGERSERRIANASIQPYVRAAQYSQLEISHVVVLDQPHATPATETKFRLYRLCGAALHDPSQGVLTPYELTGLTWSWQVSVEWSCTHTTAASLDMRSEDHVPQNQPGHRRSETA